MFNFTLPDVDGRTVRLSDYNDQKGVVVVFTCNHCPYAIAYELRLIALHQRFAPVGVPVVAISANDAVKYPQDGPDHMRTRATQRGFPYVYLYDQSQSVARAYKAERTPEVFLLENLGNGDWRQVYAGAIDDNHLDARAAQQHYLADAITQLLENQGIERPQTQAVGCSIKWA